MSNPRSERRLKRFGISADLFLHMARGTFRVVVNPAPDDAYAVAMHYDIDRDVFWVLVASATFDSVPDNYQIPEMDPPQIECVPDAEPDVIVGG